MPRTPAKAGLAAIVTLLLLSCGRDQSPVDPSGAVPTLGGRLLTTESEPIPSAIVRLGMAAPDSSGSVDTTDASGAFR